MSQESIEDFIRRGYAEFNRALQEPSGERLHAFLDEFWHGHAVYVLSLIHI